MKGSRKAADPFLVWVLAAATVVLFGLAVWLWLSGRPPGEGSSEAGFARDMSAHHTQAVEMAEIVRDKTEDEDVRILAEDIALTQQGQIGQMQGWLSAWGLSPTGSEPAMAWMEMPTEGLMPGMASPEEVEALADASPEEADRMFLELLIPHHRAALDMAQAVLEETDRPAVEELAGAIESSQRAEIEVMQEMLEDMGAPPVEDQEPSMDGMDMDADE
ncbi:DUF305 domain-containing protein (plasmid) [Rubrobacter marinus]|uniref:DUF305 domain-containing protein n=1 Tax=Rubrobacter marinus TaxID=2653852 RepID=A0A6G8Q3M5_9ACTN|nr:DUF305 domain-containing protein [Rubrobacter marinus]QIN81030.1 DUF305 domain-containing protein [Rubrobacter marinus]